jgi:hypothetical protein
MNFLPLSDFHKHELAQSSYFFVYVQCRNPSFGLATKAKVCKGAGQD